eukprot:m51a1_g13924 hypothetical protein (420) ;mRNA; r:821304-822817
MSKPVAETGIIAVPGNARPDAHDAPTGARHPLEAMAAENGSAMQPCPGTPLLHLRTPSPMPAPRNVLVLYTGGTVGMKRDPDTGAYVPDPHFLERELSQALKAHSGDESGMPEVSFAALGPPLDSSDMNSTHWALIAQAIAERYNNHDGFVVLHGTDTMAYTASALSFALTGLGKTVVVTGAQIPWCVIRSDAFNNLVDSLLVAAYSNIPEVVIVFDSKVMRGNRTTKMQSWGVGAFSSNNFPLLGEGGVRLVVFDDRVLPRPVGPLCCSAKFSSDVIVQPCFPGCERFFPALLDSAVKAGVRGVVLEAFGSGTAPAFVSLLQSIERATAAGVVVVVVSRCPSGSVSLGSYNGGYSLQRAGCVSGHDMTTEAAFTKLSWLLAQERLSAQEVRAQLETDLRGEITKGFLVNHNRNQSVIF